jgi:WD40 repeat protein
MRRLGIGTAALAALMAMAAACTSTPEPQRTGGRPAYHPSGRIVVTVGSFGGHIQLVDAATGKVIDTKLPPVFGFWDEAEQGPHGQFYAMPLVFNARSRSQLYLVGGNRPPKPVGPPAKGVIGFELRGGYAVAWRCPGVFLLKLSSPIRWERVSGGCGAALSPDGRRLAYATRSSMWIEDLPDGTPREVLRFADLRDLRRTNTPRRSLENLEWGEGGLAVAVGDSSQSAIVVWNEGRPPVIDVLGRARVEAMRWQPGGDYLAFTSFSPHGTLFGLDPRTGQERELAELGDVRGMVWSPDGRVVAAPLSTNIVALVDPDGRRVGTLTTPGIPLAWLPG